MSIYGVCKYSCPVFLFFVYPHLRDSFLMGHPPQQCLHTFHHLSLTPHRPTPVKCLSFQVRPHGSSPYCSDLLNDGGCVALLVVGFLLVTPLLVLALAAYCRLARHLQLGLCFIPYSRAVYKNLPATQHRGLAGGCCGQQSGKREGKGKVWV